MLEIGKEWKFFVKLKLEGKRGKTKLKFIVVN